MIPKGVLWYTEIPTPQVKNADLKFGNIWPKTLVLPFRKISIFGRKKNIFFKASNVSENVLWDMF